MKGLLAIVLGLLVMGGSVHGEDDLEKLADSRLAEFLEVYKELHANPELSYHEQRTSKSVARRLRDYGFEVTEGIGDYGESGRTGYGVVGLLRNGEGPTIMVRTDLDALPITEETGLPYASKVSVKTETGVQTGVMHACGHDVHMTSFLGTAALLSSLRDRWNGTLLFVGQPAEERGAGAKALLVDGLYSRFPKPDYALGLHVHESIEAGKIGFCPGYALANVDSVDITVRGIGGHGAYPHKTLDPIVLSAQMILAFQTIVSRTVSPLDPAVVTVGSIHGGTKHNIIPPEVRLQLTVRSYKPEVRRVVLDSIRRIVEETAVAAGVPPELKPTVTIAEEEYTPSTYNDPELTRRLVEAFRKELGELNVIQTDPVMAGEDFSLYRLDDNSVPSFIMWLGTIDPEKAKQLQAAGKASPPLHSDQFAPAPEPTLLTGMRAMTAAVLELMRKD